VAATKRGGLAGRPSYLVILLVRTPLFQLVLAFFASSARGKRSTTFFITNLALLRSLRASKASACL